MGDDYVGMSAEQVIVVIEELQRAGCWLSVEGGWGVDALVGYPTRPHRDLDLGLAAEHEAVALTTLQGLDYRVETDWRPSRVEMVSPTRGWVDLHSLTRDVEGNAYQSGLDGERYLYPAASFVTGHILSRPVRCLSAAQQLAWHEGYELRDSDRADVVLLRDLARHEQRPAIPSPPVDRHVVATREEVLAVRQELRAVAARYGLDHLRVTSAGTLLVSARIACDHLLLERFASASAAAVQAWVNVVADDAPWAPLGADATHL